MGDYDYDGQGQGGGGYSPGLPENASSPPKKMRANQSLIPVTIKQINEGIFGTDEQIRIDGRETNQLTIVGVIRSVAEHNTNIVYSIEDGTSFIEAKQWIGASDNDEAAQKRTNLREGIYVRVVGLIKVFNEKRSLAIYHMRPIEDFNEITHHFLEALHAHLYNTRGPHAAQAHPDAHPAAAASSSLKTPSKAGNPSHQRQNHQQQQQQQQQQQEPQQTLPQQILQLLTNHRSTDGLSINEIANVFRDVASYESVKEAVDYLSDEAIIYPTIDDQHYAITEDKLDHDL